MLKRILLCTTYPSPRTPRQSCLFFSARSRRERLMAKRYFTLAVVVLVVVMGSQAFAQWGQVFGEESTQGTGTAGEATFAPLVYNGNTMSGNPNSPFQAQTISNSLPDSIPTPDAPVPHRDVQSGGAGEWAGGGAGAMAAGAQYGNFLGQRGMNSFLYGTTTAVKAWAAGQTAVAFGMGAGINAILTLFPQFRPGANCPICIVRMVQPVGPVFEEPFGWEQGLHGTKIGNSFRGEMNEFVNSGGFDYGEAAQFERASKLAEVQNHLNDMQLTTEIDDLEYVRGTLSQINKARMSDPGYAQALKLYLTGAHPTVNDALRVYRLGLR